MIRSVSKETKSGPKVIKKWTKRVTKGNERQASDQKIHEGESSVKNSSKKGGRK